MNKKNFKIIVFTAYFLFIIFSFILNFNPGKEIGNNFLVFLLDITSVA